MLLSKGHYSRLWKPQWKGGLLTGWEEEDALRSEHSSPLSTAASSAQQVQRCHSRRRLLEPRSPALPLAGQTMAIRDQGWQSQVDARTQTVCPPSQIPSGLKDNRSSVQQRYEELLFITMTIVISTYVLINTNTMKMTIPPSVVIPGNNSFGKYISLYTRSYL